MSDTASTGATRRGFRVIAGTGVCGWSAGCVDVNVDSEIDENAGYGGSLSDANGYDGLQADGDNRYGGVRQIDTDRVRITVGSPTGSGRLTNQIRTSGASDPITNAFLSAAIEISPGTTVEWVWIGDGGRYHVVAKDGSFSKESHTEQGTTVIHTHSRTAA